MRHEACPSALSLSVSLLPAIYCGASNRSGVPCRRRPPPGKLRCRYHGGAPGSGPPLCNANALKHGFYSARVRDFAGDILAAEDLPLDFRDEIALFRAVLARAVATAQPQTVALIISTLARLITAQSRLDTLAGPVVPRLTQAELDEITATFDHGYFPDEDDD